MNSESLIAYGEIWYDHMNIDETELINFDIRNNGEMEFFVTKAYADVCMETPSTEYPSLCNIVNAICDLMEINCVQSLWCETMAFDITQYEACDENFIKHILNKMEFCYELDGDIVNSAQNKIMKDWRYIVNDENRMFW